MSKFKMIGYGVGTRRDESALLAFATAMEPPICGLEWFRLSDYLKKRLLPNFAMDLRQAMSEASARRFYEIGSGVERAERSACLYLAESDSLGVLKIGLTLTPASRAVRLPTNFRSTQASVNRNGAAKGRFLRPCTDAERAERLQAYRTLAEHNEISALARLLGKNRTTVQLVLQGRKTSRDILRAATERAIALRANAAGAV